MAKVVLTFEDLPDGGLAFTDELTEFDGAEDAPPTNAELMGAIVTKLVEGILGEADEQVVG